jgi:HAAS
MNDTTVRYPAGLAECVSAYVREVRAELADLPAEDVDDLTGGMEADLSELAAESGGDLIGRLGTPKVYAAELRAAAGLPERGAGKGRQRSRVSDALTHARSSFTMLTEQHPWLRSFTAFLVTLRPAWWVVRGYLAAWAVVSLIGGMQGLRPHGVLGLGMALVAMVVSVKLGRGWLRHMAMTRPLLVLGNAIAVVVVLVASTSVEVVRYDQSSDFSQPAGVSLDGTYVGNIYAYDADGQRITGVRLFAQDGRPLGGGDNAFGPNGNQIAVVRDGSGAPVTNAYPRALFGPDPWQVVNPTDPQVDPGQWTPPMSIVPLAPSSTVPASGTATPTATAPTSKPVPPTSASTTPTSGPSPSVTRSGR